MFVHDLKPHIPVEPGLWQKMQQIQPASLGHYLANGIVDPAVRSVGSGKRMIGRALTVRQPLPDAVPVHVAFDFLQPGDVLVIDRAGDHRVACIGEITAHMGVTRGIAGFVVDGIVTDIEELRALELPVYARGINVVTTRTLDAAGADLFGPVVIGDVVVRTGDIVMGDANGVLFIDPAMPGLEALVDRAISDEAREKDWKARISAGESLSSINGSRALFDARMKGK